MIDVDVILTGGIVAAMNDGVDLFDPGAAVGRAGVIETVGQADQAAAVYAADDVVDCTGCFVIPGFINAYTHALMTLFRGLDEVFQRVAQDKGCECIGLPVLNFWGVEGSGKSWLTRHLACRHRPIAPNLQSEWGGGECCLEPGWPFARDRRWA